MFAFFAVYLTLDFFGYIGALRVAYLVPTLHSRGPQPREQLRSGLA